MTFLGELMYEWSQIGPSYETVISTALYLQGRPERKHLEDVISKRLLVFDRFRSVVSRDKKTNDWTWTTVSQEDVDLDYHICEVELPEPVEKAEVEKFVGLTYGKPMDPTRPLWRCYILSTVDGCACVIRIHHSVGDGTTLVEVLFKMMEESKDTRPHSSKKRKRDWLQLLVNPLEVSSQAFLLLWGVLMGLTFIFHPPDSPSCLKLSSVKKLSTRKIVASAKSIPLKLFKEAGKRIGGTVNDVVMATLTSTIRRYLKEHKDSSLSAKGRLQYTVFFPMNMRTGPPNVHDPSQFGNQFTLVPMNLPIHEEDPSQVLMTTKQYCDEMKASPMALIITILNKIAMNILSPQLYHKITFYLFEKGSGFVTNVPGPTKPVYIAGHEVTDMMFYVPAFVACTFTIMSYNGSVNFGCLVDQGDSGIDPSKLTKFFYEEFFRLHSEAKSGIRISRDSTTRTW
eukprot:CAMPEP_0114527612 /NCGR_PEP_ID=MMETSP0109-20121206/23721_1 /TAXON_ID=29199 /ORGANISM="Chlorarachnion reptans, Strain CCCM449" /LENGTH=454 /DNA_ID=CAMNT_0001709613 /DNA_START=321 /DNA_END=1682 /DNA_ORIENTATION=-